LRQRSRILTPWRVQITPFFEAGFNRACRDFDRNDLLDGLEIFAHGVERQPRAVGRMHSEYEWWVFELKDFVRLPKMWFNYTINDGDGVVRARSLAVFKS
jgi:hypothetical protein